MWRRRLTRAEDRKSLEQVSRLAGELKNCRRELRIAIGVAKKKAWDELLEGLSEDPWGRPYKIIMNKIRLNNLDICRKLPEETIENILGTLFPKDRGVNKYNVNRNAAPEWVPAITREEFDKIVKRTIKNGKKAPGPDGLLAGLVAEAHQSAEALYRGLYDGCLRTEKFPDRWKVARIVLIKKEGKPDGVASSYRPLCLLNEQGKMMERIIKIRIEESMRESREFLSGNQYGFRIGRSTIDTIMKVRDIIESKLNKGLEVVAVSLDIKNAFNSIEWGVIRKAIERNCRNIFRKLLVTI